MSTDRNLTGLFLKVAARHKRKYAQAFMLIPLIAGLTALGPKVVQWAIDQGMSQGDMAVLLRMTLLFMVVVLIRLILEPVQLTMMQNAGIRTLKDLRELVVKHIIRLDKARYDTYPLGVLVARTTSDVEAIGETLANNLMSIITDIITVLVILFIIMWMDVKLGLVTLALLPLVGGVIAWFGARIRVFHEKLRTLNGELAGQLNETVSMRHEIINFHLSGGLIRDFDTKNRKYYQTSMRTVSYDAATFSVIEGLSYIAIGLALMLVSRSWFMQSTISIGEVVMYVLYLQDLFNPFKQLGQRFTSIQATFAALNKINKLLSIPLPEDKGSEEPRDGNLALREVRFAYEDGHEVLKGLSVDVPEGRSLAIVGPTGSGKTTMVRLLTRQFEAASGLISLGSKALSSVRRETLKKWIVLVPQEPTIIDGSILENIRLNRPEVTRDHIEDVCKKITADRFIERLPDGLDTRLTPGGGNLSMGQRQLVALARALVSESKILVFDESTANIDTETELMIQKALDFVMTQKTTTIIIAHRLSTIRHVNHILVMKNGIIDEEGTHRELMEQGGLYSKMYALQVL